MHRIDTSTAQKDKWGAGKNGWTNGDPATGVRATSFNASFCDAVQEEICNAIEKSGLTLDPNDNTQLFKVLSKITTGMGDYLAIDENLAEIAAKGTGAQKSARDNLGLGTLATKDSLSAEDVGAVAKTGDTMSGVLKVGAEIQTTAWDSYRMVVGNYGTFWRQDGNTLYLMLTNAGNQYGSYNDFRPFIVDLATGAVTLPGGTSVNGILHAGELNAGAARFTNDGNAFGSIWGGDWLSNYINSRLAKSPNAVGVGGVGTYAFCTYKYASIAPNQLVSGGDLFISGVGAQKSSSGWGDKSLIIDQSGTLSGTWMCCGAQPGPDGSDIGATLYFRIA
ncbi:phage tail fiber protein [Enterobacter quasiroggenkampii]|uniref:phage tail fiber protein n=1 Tax=Enterobacter quasiroggenkampii TaxID=2497436 RepID=UPI001F4826E5|nr:hypothetical protein [Enterobacter quasiroggenkampii]